MDQVEGFLTTREASDFIKIAVPTLEGFRVNGGGPVFVKIGRRVVYAKAALLAYMNDNTRTSTSDAGTATARAGKIPARLARKI